MERGEEETSRDEHDEIVREEETRDELEEISIEEEDWDEVDDGAAAPPSPPPTFEPWRENWESKLRDASRERNVKVLKGILHEERLLHKAVERGEIDFVRDFTQFRWFDPKGEGETPDLAGCILELIIEIWNARSKPEWYDILVSSSSHLRLESPEYIILRRTIDKTDLFGLDLIVPVEVSRSEDSGRVENLFHAFLNWMKALVMSARSSIFLRTPLHVAVLNRDLDITKYLLDEQDKLVDCVSLDDSWYKDVYCLTPLHYAVLMDDKKLVKMLVKSRYYSAFVNVCDFSHRTPLHLACARGDEQGETRATKVVATLLRSFSVDLNAKDCCGYTPLHWAVHVGALGAVNLLMDRQIKLDEKDVDGKTVIHHVHASARSTAGDVQRRDLMLELESVFTSDPRVEKIIDHMYRDRQVYMDAANAILVGAALIASVTYGGWLQPPLGDHEEHTRKIVRLFWVFNSLSFSFAIAAVQAIAALMAGEGTVLSVADLFIEDAVARVRDWLALTAFLLLVSAAFVLGAFGAAGFASMTTVGDLEANMTATTIVGGAVCLLIASVFLRGLYRVSSVWPSKRLLKGCARLFSSPSAPLQAQRGISLLLYEQLRLSAMTVNFDAVHKIMFVNSIKVFASDFRSTSTYHLRIQFPTTLLCRQFCMERDSLFPFRLSEPSQEEWKEIVTCNQEGMDWVRRPSRFSRYFYFKND